MPRVRANGVELEVVVDGEGGEPLLLIMGIGAQLIWWPDELVERLVDAGFEVIRFDNRDVGRSQSLDELGVPPALRWLPLSLLGRPLPQAPYTLWDMADDTAALVEAMGHDRAHVVGVSMGGMIAQCLALRHPERVASTTLLMTASGARRHAVGDPRAIKALLAPAPQTPDEAAEATVRLYGAIGSPGFPLEEEVLRRKARLAFERGRNPKGFLRQFGAILATEDRTPLLRRLEGTPVSVVHGAADPLIPVRAGKQLARAIPGARLVVNEGQGHSLPTPLLPGITEVIRETAGG